MKISRRFRPNMCHTWTGVKKRPSTTRTSATMKGCETDSKKKKPKNAAKRTTKKD